MIAGYDASVVGVLGTNLVGSPIGGVCIRRSPALYDAMIGP